MLSNFKTDRQDKKNIDYKILLAGAANLTGKKVVENKGFFYPTSKAPHCIFN